jgi:hypothetical protein
VVRTHLRPPGKTTQRDAEQSGQRLRGPLPGQELPGVQVHDDRRDPRPCCTGPSAPGGTGPLLAPAFPLDQPMLDHPDRSFAQAGDLAAVRPGDWPPGPVLVRSDRGGGLPGPSLNGGRDEFRELCLSRASSADDQLFP